MDSSSSQPGWSRLEALLDQALELPIDRRGTLLDRVGREDPALRERVEQLLAADAAAGDFLNDGAEAWLRSGPLTPAHRAEQGALDVGARVGPYRVIHELGRGGMGIVYRAERADGEFAQVVAVKLVRRGLDGDGTTIRFRRERQILAQLDHPAIARLLDGGLHTDGRPYFAMELVDGEPITTYCDRRLLSIDARVQLFGRVCEAVQYAHGRLIVHRDLKPANIFVTTTGDLKLLDFGIAKLLTNDDASESPELTRTGLPPLTPAYAAPEQLRGEPASTATDVYALGVILFELLTGRRPPGSASSGFDRAALDAEPPRPSNVVVLEDPDEAQSIDEIAHARSVAPRVLAASLTGDLDAIVLKALRREPRHRYIGAGALFDDLERFLQGQPVTARPDDRRYRAGKFVRRHRVGLAVAASLVALLVAFAATTAFQARRLAQERDRANREAQTAQAVNDFLQNDLLAQAGASAQARTATKADPDLKVRTALDRAAARIEGKFQAQPLVEASIRLTIGKTYKDLGLYQEAEQHLGRALDLHRGVLGERHVDSLTATGEMASLLIREAKYEDADRLLTKSLETAQQTVGAGDPHTLMIMSNLAQSYMFQGKHAEAESFALKVVDGNRRVLGQEHQETLTSMGVLASLYWRQGKYAEAEPVRAQVVQLQRRLLGDEHPDTLTSTNNLALITLYRGKYAEAEALLTQLLETMRRVLGEEHMETMISTGNLGLVYFRQGRYGEAEPLFEKTLALKQRVLGDLHPETLTSMNNLAVLYRTEGKYQQAESLYRRVQGINSKVFGEEHPNTMLTMNGIAFLYMLQGKTAQAEALYNETLGMQRRILGEEHPDTINTTSNLAAMYVKEGRNAEAESLSTKVLDVRRRVLGERHLDTLRSMNALALLYLNTGRSTQAESLLRAALGIYEMQSPDSWERYNCTSMLGGSLAAQNRYEEAEPLLVQGYEALLQKRSMIPAGNSAVDEAGQRIVQLYRSWRKADKAAEWTKALGR
jgi:serine/threonine protein kinase/heme exporter protein D